MTVTSKRSRLGRAARWAALLVLVAQGGLVFAGVLDVKTALLVAVGLETLGALVAVALAATFWRSYRRLRAGGHPPYPAFTGAVTAVLPAPMALVLRHELGVARALWLAVRRRREVPAGGTAVPYSRSLALMLWVLLALSVVEIGAVELLVPWPGIRMALLVVSLYGLVWMLGFRAALYTRPHVVGPQTLLLRLGYLAQVEVALSAVESASCSLRGSHHRTVEVDGGTLALSVMGGTTVAVRLRGETAVTVNASRAETVREIRFHADDPQAAVDAIRAATTAVTAAAGPAPV